MCINTVYFFNFVSINYYYHYYSIRGGGGSIHFIRFMNPFIPFNSSFIDSLFTRISVLIY